MIFTNGSVILCGWEPQKRRGRMRGGLYGIGGKMEPGDRGDYRLTAAREVLEELFGLGPTVPTSLIQAVAALRAERVEMVDRYVIIHHGFTALRTIMRLVRRSPLYPRGMPQNLEGLLLERRCDGTRVEMAQLCLLPVVPVRLHISNELVDDIVRLAAKHRAPLENGQQQLQPTGTPASAAGSSRSIGSAAATACSHN